MCGLVGTAGNLAFKDEATMKRLLILDYFRGTDSTGIATYHNNGTDYAIAKIASHPIDLFDTKAFGKAMNGNMNQVFLGHNRAATLGKVNGLNAHPFHYGKIVGAHNGTLDKQSWERLEEAAGVETSVDSAAIFACIDKIGIEKTVELMEEGSDAKKGAWALVWFNMEDESINFLRNKHRPLSYAYTEDQRQIFWASEWPMMEAATNMSGASYDLLADKDGHMYFDFAEDWWYRFDLKELKQANKTSPLKPKVKQLKGREKKSYFTSSGYTGGVNQQQGKPPFRANQGTQTSNTGTPSKSGNASASQSAVVSNIDIKGTAAQPYGNYIDKTDFAVLARYGCAFCSTTVDYGETGITILETEDAVLCPTCTGPSYEGTVRIFCNPESYETAIGRNTLSARM